MEVFFMSDERKELGQKGERAAASFLENRGLTILDRNWKCSYGEVDIVAKEEDTLIFCEVKTRRSSAAGFPEESVTLAKQKRYSRIAGVYTSRFEEEYTNIRFDVIAIFVLTDSQALLRYIKNAFSVTEP